MLRSNVEIVCDQHPDRNDCPDAIVDFNGTTGFYGLFVRDGENASAGSVIIISYCPWCGAELPKGLDDL
jgi:hypothetical protein